MQIVVKKLVRTPLYVGVLCTLGWLSGCSQLPEYKPPVTELKGADVWKDNPWQQATPLDQMSRGAWWTQWGDPTLNTLEQKLNDNSPSIAIALARFDAANAYADQARSAQYASVDGGATALRNRQSDNRPLRAVTQPSVYGANTAGISVNYELDLWGRVRSVVAAGEADAQAAAADLESVRLSLQALLAQDYVQLRAMDAEISLLQQTLQTYEQALILTQHRHRGGVSSGIDESRAQTQLSTARAQNSELLIQRSLYEHAIAALIGLPPQGFSLPEAAFNMPLPDIPVGLPSTLLQRRPDIASAERSMAAANARVGIANAAFFPTFTIGPTFGYQNMGGPDWLSAPNSFWSMGPAAFFNLFDGGLRQGQVNRAKAALDEASARYRLTVVSAFQEVQDNMSRLSFFKTELQDQTDAGRAAALTLKLAMTRYREGAVNYLEVVTAQTTDLQVRRDILRLQAQRLLAGINLTRALGGGWMAEQD